MKKLLFPVFALVVLCSHDMYLKLDSYFLEPNSEVAVQLFNGTFAESENTIDRNRMVDVSVVANGQRRSVDTTQWREDGSVTILDFTTGEPGTYVAGVSTRARSLAMEADAFNRYLEHDGVVDELEKRRSEGTLETNTVEKYSKHVKTIIQVGETRTDDWQTALGYPIEFVPLSNPYDLHAGDRLRVRLLWQGEPLVNQLVIVDAEVSGHGNDHDHDHGATSDHDHEHGEETEGHTHEGMSQLRTDAEGVIDVEVTHDGSWFLRTIYMQNSREEGLTHESNWATLTFGVDHGQSHSHAGDADHTHEHGIPSYAWWIGSVVLVGGLFFYFQKRA